MNAGSSSGTGNVRFGTETEFTGVKVFSATMMADRARLGETVTSWIQEHPDHEIREIILTQSSDDAFHCLTLTVFYFELAE